MPATAHAPAPTPATVPATPAVVAATSSAMRDAPDEEQGEMRRGEGHAISVSE